MIKSILEVSMDLVWIIIIWSGLLGALFLWIQFVFIWFTILGEDYRHKKIARELNLDTLRRMERRERQNDYTR